MNPSLVNPQELPFELQPGDILMTEPLGAHVSIVVDLPEYNGLSQAHAYQKLYHDRKPKEVIGVTKLPPDGGYRVFRCKRQELAQLAAYYGALWSRTIKREETFNVKLPFASPKRRHQINNFGAQRPIFDASPRGIIKVLQNEFFQNGWLRAIKYAARRMLSPFHIDVDPESKELKSIGPTVICSSFVAICYQAAALDGVVKACKSFDAQDWPSIKYHNSPSPRTEKTYKHPLDYWTGGAQGITYEQFDWAQAFTNGLLFDAKYITPEEFALCLEHDPDNWQDLGLVPRAQFTREQKYDSFEAGLDMPPPSLGRIQPQALPYMSAQRHPSSSIIQPPFVSPNYRRLPPNSIPKTPFRIKPGLGVFKKV